MSTISSLNIRQNSLANPSGLRDFHFGRLINCWFDILIGLFQDLWFLLCWESNPVLDKSLPLSYILAYVHDVWTEALCFISDTNNLCSFVFFLSWPAQRSYILLVSSENQLSKNQVSFIFLTNSLKRISLFSIPTFIIFLLEVTLCLDIQVCFYFLLGLYSLWFQFWKLLQFASVVFRDSCRSLILPVVVLRNGVFGGSD